MGQESSGFAKLGTYPKMDMVNGVSTASSSELLQAQAHVWNVTFNYINSMSLKCAVQLGIPDVIHSHGQPMTLSQIASALKIPPNKAHCIQRLMRILVHSGFFAQQKFDRDEQEVLYSLTLASKLLLKDEPLRAAPIVLLMCDPVVTRPFDFMSSWFQNDDHTAIETAHGKGFWDCVAQEKDFKKVFYDAMVTDSELIASVVIKDCGEVFKGLKSLVDVGGGTGTMAKAVAAAFPEIKCTVFDLQHVVDNLLGSKNLEFKGGDMFEAVPPADAVLLKWILHDWGDEESVKILKKCKEAIPDKEKGGKVIIIDMVMENKNKDKESVETQLYFDMVMMCMFNIGKERTIKEWKRLFREAGFNHYKITHILGVRSLIEAYP